MTTLVREADDLLKSDFRATDASHGERGLVALERNKLIQLTSRSSPADRRDMAGVRPSVKKSTASWAALVVLQICSLTFSNLLVIDF